MTTRKTIALTICAFVGKVVSLLFNLLIRSALKAARGKEYNIKRERHHLVLQESESEVKVKLFNKRP